jgi:hypothetical protein
MFRKIYKIETDHTEYVIETEEGQTVGVINSDKELDKYTYALRRDGHDYVMITLDHMTYNIAL